MTSREETAALKFALCIRNDGYPVSLDLEKVYPVLPDGQSEANGMLRVVDESGEDYLYPSSLFQLVEISDEARERLARVS